MMQSQKTSLTTLLEVIAQENHLTERSTAYLGILAHQITMLELAFEDYRKISQASQPFVWRNLEPSKNGRWLTRESARFPSCANS